jgi:hypothetical protein
MFVTAGYAGVNCLDAGHLHAHVEAAQVERDALRAEAKLVRAALQWQARHNRIQALQLGAAAGGEQCLN